mmetsp:Transcript_17770/g.34703  ORF Transcript_17770/g.34703 Transcript_17770/m.34703 type:complete len:1092 (+) Transcript_17770:117-3392(+)|eukprot:CAMPEP_0175141566 /NCGR_PEP_ID=MMETSP0087-20121206/12215_1 /TAXON_ID=136419 /ORGANISM="Unknown Unknown, Strain D1" /LENGTH=1091 /DNA_ID=CAMNT_0016425073 /DNA_START=117 /DNA_END=3392 /DNA_ORIENTATION=-
MAHDKESTNPPSISSPLKQKVRQDEIDFQKVLNLFTHRHTSQLFSRQAATFQKVSRVCAAKGLRMSYLRPVQDMIKFALAAIEEGPDGLTFLDPLCGVIALHGKPFDTIRAFCELENADVLSTSLSIIGTALSSKHPKLVIAIANMISDFVNLNRDTSTLATKLNGQANPVSAEALEAAATKTAFNQPSDAPEETTEDKMNLVASAASPIDLTKAPPHELRYYIVAHSGIIGLLLDSLQQNADNPEIALALAGTCRDLSYALITSKQLSLAGFFDIASMLLDHDARSQIVNVVVELIWNLIEMDPVAIEAFGTELNVRVLSRLLSQLLDEGYRLQDKYLRNEILVILNLIARIPANRKHLARTPTLRTILLYATYAELDGNYDSDTPMCQPFTQSTDDSDMEMKILLWTISALCVTEQFSHAQIVQAELLRALFLYIEDDVAEAHASVSRWSFTQLMALQKYALQALYSLVPSLPQQYAFENGNEKLIRFAERIVQNADNSVDKQLSREHLLELQAIAISVVLQACWHVDFAAADQTSECFAILVNLFANDEVSLAVKADSISILCFLTKTNEHNRRLFRKEGGLKAVVELLSKPGNVKKYVKQSPRLLYSVVDCIWQTVANNKRNEAHFLVQDGIDSLLDLVNADSPFKMKKQVIGCIADLLVNHKSKKYVHEWRGRSKSKGDMKQETTALSMLLDLWVQQEAKSRDKGVMGVFTSSRKAESRATPKRTARIATPPATPPRAATTTTAGSISSVDDSDMKGLFANGGKLQAEEEAKPEKGDEIDMRTAIYAVFNALEFQFPYATPTQKAQMKAVEGYVAFRRGQVFYDIGAELTNQEGVIPVSEDRQFLAFTVEHCQRMADDIRTFQIKQKQEVTSASKTMMDAYFETIQRRKDQDKSAPQANSNRANFSMMRNRLAAKEMKEDMLKQSLDVDATLKKTAGSGARAARNLRGGAGGIYTEADLADGSDDEDLQDPQFEAKLLSDLKLQGLTDEYPDPASRVGTAASLAYPGEKPSSPPPVFDPRPITQGVQYIQESILEDEGIEKILESTQPLPADSTTDTGGDTTTAKEGDAENTAVAEKAEEQKAVQQ